MPAGYKLLQLCHKVLTFSENSKRYCSISLCVEGPTCNPPLLPPSLPPSLPSKVVLFVTHFLLHSGGVKAVLSRLCVGVDTVNELTSLDYS